MISGSRKTPIFLFLFKEGVYMTSLSPLFKFDSIVDINMSIFSMVYDLYDTKKYIRDDIMRDDYSLKCLFLTMKNKNPLEYLVREEYSDSYDNLYQEFRNDPKLVDYYKFFDTARMVRMMEDISYLNPCILCQNQREKMFVENTFHRVKILMGEININGKYETYYTDDVTDIGTIIKDPVAIHFKLLRFQYNLEKKRGIEIPKLKIVLPYLDVNKFSYIDPYTNIIVPDE